MKTTMIAAVATVLAVFSAPAFADHDDGFRRRDEKVVVDRDEVLERLARIEKLVDKLEEDGDRRHHKRKSVRQERIDRELAELKQLLRAAPEAAPIVSQPPPGRP